MQLNLVKVF